MTQYIPTFNTSEFEERNYISPWFTSDQQTTVTLTKNRVNEQLDWVGQLLGWNGGNYWDNLASTVSQKRQLLGGSYGVYNSFMVAHVLSVRNWSNEVVIEPIDGIVIGLSVFLGTQKFEIKSITNENSTQVISLGVLPQSFYTELAANKPLKINIPTVRPAPFYRPSIGTSGDNSFFCNATSTSLSLYPSWDTLRQFPYLFPTFFAGSVYYFNQPVFLSYTSSFSTDIAPQYDSALELWYLTIPDALSVSSAGLAAYLVWSYSDTTSAVNSSIAIKVQKWSDPSDWGSINILNNFTGAWGNKGGVLPFNLTFDCLGIHGFNETTSIELLPFSRTLSFDSLVLNIYDQITTVSWESPNAPKLGQSWWNTNTGVFSVWFGDYNSCTGWVDVSYRIPPITSADPIVTYTDVTTFTAGASSLPIGTTVEILDITGLSITDNVIGVQGTLTTAGTLVLYRANSSVYWTPSKFTYTNVTNWAAVASLLPYQTPVLLADATGLGAQSSAYTITNLAIEILGSYSVLLQKRYSNTTWQIFPDTELKFIANSSLSGSLKNGALWWDYTNPTIITRAASVYVTSPSPVSSLVITNTGVGLTDGVYTGVPLILQSASGGGGLTADITVSGGIVISTSINNAGDLYQQGNILIPDSASYPSLAGCVFTVDTVTLSAWVSINTNTPLSTPSVPLNTDVLLFYCDGVLLQNGTAYSTSNYTFQVNGDSINAQYTFTYTPRNFIGATQFPIITISDNLTTAYTSDISNQVFSGLAYKMSPNVYDAEFPMRLWKSEELQVVETFAHLAEQNYINPFRADINNGPATENWERYFVRMPLDYGRNGDEWQKTALVLQNFGYWGSSIFPEQMDCPTSLSVPIIYDELFLYPKEIPDYAYVYSEPYFYSNIAFFDDSQGGVYANAGIYPTQDLPYDDFTESRLVEYAPLHNRRANVTSSVGSGYGNWLGEYVNINPCTNLTGFLEVDLLSGGVSPIIAPIWDASIYKIPPTCDSDPYSFNVDANHYRVGYAYFVADASCAEDGFFDIQQKSAWRQSTAEQKSLYMIAG